MKIGTTRIPRYLTILKRAEAAFPLSSSRGMKNLAKLMAYVQPALERIDLKRPTIEGLPRGEFKSTASSQQIIDYILGIFNGLPNWAHPLTQKNLMPPTTAVSVVTAFLTALFNPDICSTEFSGKRLTEAEEEVVKVLSRIVGYDPRVSYGFFTYGGTLSIQYGILLGLERASSGRYQFGQEKGVKILCSDAAHFSVRSAAGILGLGTENVVRVRTNENDEISLSHLEREGNEILKRGEKIAAVVATIGTTDVFGLDNLAGIAQIRNHWISKFGLDYPISIHADAVVGWAWGFFKNYDFETNPLQFPRETLEAIQKIVKRISNLNLADSIGLNPHKYGYVPIPASFILFRRNGELLAPLKRQADDMPQLYNVGQRHPGAYTIETTRYAGGVLGTLANLRLLGEEGYQAVLGRIVEMGILLREKLAGIERIKIINSRGVGGGTIFYFCLPGQSIAAQNDLNERILKRLQGGSGDFAINLSSALRPDGRVALKSLIISPFATEEDIDKVVRLVAEAAEKELRLTRRG